MFLRLRVTLKGDEKDAARKKALDLSLRYEFVTSLTSMVVTKPQEQETQVAHKPKEGAELIKKAHNRRVTGHSARRPAGYKSLKFFCVSERTVGPKRYLCTLFERNMPQEHFSNNPNKKKK